MPPSYLPKTLVVLICACLCWSWCVVWTGLLGCQFASRSAVSGGSPVSLWALPLVHPTVPVPSQLAFTPFLCAPHHIRRPADQLVVTNSGELQLRVGNVRGSEIYNATLRVTYSRVAFDGTDPPFAICTIVCLCVPRSRAFAPDGVHVCVAAGSRAWCAPIRVWCAVCGRGGATAGVIPQGVHAVRVRGPLMSTAAVGPL